MPRWTTQQHQEIEQFWPTLQRHWAGRPGPEHRYRSCTVTAVAGQPAVKCYVCGQVLRWPAWANIPDAANAIVDEHWRAVGHPPED